MSPKSIIIVGTMAFAITIGSGIWSDKAGASPMVKVDVYKLKQIQLPAQQENLTARDHYLRFLGAESDEEVYDSLMDGKTLAEIANANEADVQNVIALQIAQMTEQLDKRLAGGGITPDAYFAQKAELADIVTKSAYGEKYD